MIPARKVGWFRALFARHAAARMKRSFEAVHVRGVAEAKRALASGPVICVANHVSWWDALVALVLGDRILGADGYALMNEENLVRFPFFSLVGAIGARRASAADGARVVRHAASLLDRPGRLVWVFAQGRERATMLSPLEFEGGAAAIARLRPEAAVLPIALRYEPGPTPLSRLFIDIGGPLPKARDREEARAAQERAVAELLERSADALTQGDLSAYEVWSRARRSRIDVWLERALALLTRRAAKMPARDRSQSSRS